TFKTLSLCSVNQREKRARKARMAGLFCSLLSDQDFPDSGLFFLICLWYTLWHQCMCYMGRSDTRQMDNKRPYNDLLKNLFHEQAAEIVPLLLPDYHVEAVYDIEMPDIKSTPLE